MVVNFTNERVTKRFDDSLCFFLTHCAIFLIGTPMDLFDLAMVDTLRAYPRLSIQPFRDMIAGETLLIHFHPYNSIVFSNDH